MLVFCRVTQILGRRSPQLLLEGTQVIVQAIEPRVPELPVVGQPSIDLAQRARGQAAGAPLRRPRTRDRAGALEDFQVLGDGRPADLERLGELVDAHLAAGQAGEDGAPGRISQGSEGRSEGVGAHN